MSATTKGVLAVLDKAIEYAEKASAKATSEVPARAAEASWYYGRAGAYEDMAGLLRLGRAAVKELK